MSSVNLINSGVLNVFNSKINEELEVFEGDGATINVVLGGDTPVVTNSRFQRVEQFFSIRETERRDLLTRITDLKD